MLAYTMSSSDKLKLSGDGGDEGAEPEMFS